MQRLCNSLSKSLKNMWLLVELWSVRPSDSEGERHKMRVSVISSVLLRKAEEEATGVAPAS